MLDLKTGLHPNVPASAYHQRKLGIASNSTLDLIARSPAHYKLWLDGAPDEETPALTFGRAFHSAVLEPDKFAADYAVAPDFGDCRLKANKAERDNWRLANEGKEQLSADFAEDIEAMVRSIHAHPLASRMVLDGEPELTLSWVDDETGLRVKSRADYYVRKLGMIVDVKSTLDARPEAFKRDVVKYRYHVQDALYRAGFEAVGEDIKHFVFVAVEKTAPYNIGIFSLDAEAVAMGGNLARRNMNTMAECIKNDAWPGYYAGIQTLSLPPWAA